MYIIIMLLLLLLPPQPPLLLLLLLLLLAANTTSTNYQYRPSIAFVISETKEKSIIAQFGVPVTLYTCIRHVLGSNWDTAIRTEGFRNFPRTLRQIPEC
jgi:hypothetical protein